MYRVMYSPALNCPCTVWSPSSRRSSLLMPTCGKATRLPSAASEASRDDRDANPASQLAERWPAGQNKAARRLQKAGSAACLFLPTQIDGLSTTPQQRKRCAVEGCDTDASKEGAEGYVNRSRTLRSDQPVSSSIVFFSMWPAAIWTTVAPPALRASRA